MTVKVQTFAVVDMGSSQFLNALATLRMKKQQYGHKASKGRSSKEMVKCDLAEFELTGLKTDKKENLHYSLSMELERS